MQDSGGLSKSWIVTIAGRRPFTMGGDPMTYAEALAAVRCVWATTKPGLIQVRPAQSK